MLEFLAVALGGTLGGVLRYWVTAWITRLAGEDFPWGTLVVNLSGAVLAGLAFALFKTPDLAYNTLTLLLITGFCGSYTTVSSLALQTLKLILDGHHGRALINILMTASAGLFAVWLGLSIGRWLVGGLS